MGIRTTLPRVVLIDDDAFAIGVLEDLIVEYAEVERVCFTDSKEAIDWLDTNVPDVIITDFDMPGLNGVEVVQCVRGSPHTADVPVLMLTGMADPRLRVRALEAGASDYITKPFDPAEVRTRLRNMLTMREGQQALKRRAEDLACQVDEALREIRFRERETILRLARAAEFRDEDTHAHLLRISEYASVICESLGLTRDATEELKLAAPMHDIGKIGLPDEVLRKPGRLTELEFELVKTHTLIGHQILEGSDSRLLRAAAEIAVTHHERWDGGGYPHGLAGEAIPLTGRVVAVADVFDALTTKRAYKDAWSTKDAFEYIRAGSARHFDPGCADAFLERSADVETIARRLRDGG